jgi:hypothetical protein
MSEGSGGEAGRGVGVGAWRRGTLSPANDTDKSLVCPGHEDGKVGTRRIQRRPADPLPPPLD